MSLQFALCADPCSCCALVSRPPVGTVPLQPPRGTRGALGKKQQHNGGEEAVLPTGPTGAMMVQNTSHNRRSRSRTVIQCVCRAPTHSRPRTIQLTLTAGATAIVDCQHLGHLQKIVSEFVTDKQRNGGERFIDIC